MRNDVKQNVEGVEQQRVAKPRRVLALAMMFGMFGVGAGQLASASEMTFASDLATASSKQRAVKPVDTDTGPWPLCSGATNSKALDGGEQVLGLYPMGDGTYLLHTVDAVESRACVKSTAAQLAFQFEGSTDKAVIADSSPPGSPVVYDFSAQPAELLARVTEPVLCHGYYTADDKLALVLTDSNGDEHELRGVETVNYQLSSATVTPMFTQAAHGPMARCHVFPLGATTANPPPASDPDTSDNLFSAGFESVGDLEVTLLDAQGSPLQIGHVTAAAGNEFTYKVRVRNLGEGPAQGVQLREFLPASGGAVAPVIEARNCVRDDSVPCSGVLDVALGTLNAGQSVEFTLTREVPVGGVGSRALAAVAAFSNPTNSADPVLSNNARALVVEIVNQIAITRSVKTNGVIGDSSGGDIVRTSAPTACASESAGTTTCPPGTTGLVYTATANGGYTFTGFTGCAGTTTGESAAGGIFTTTGGTSCTVTANFHSMPTVIATAGANGSIGPTTQQIDYGSVAEVTITPDTGYAVSTATGCGGLVQTGTATWETGPVTADCTVHVEFSGIQSVVTATAGPNGQIIGPSVKPVTYPNQAVSFVVQAEDNTYQIDQNPGGTCPMGVWVGGNEYFISGILGDCTVHFTFSLITHQVTLGSMANGTLALANGGVVTHGQNAEFTVQPATGYHLDGQVSGTSACGTVTDDGVTGSAGPITGAGCELSANFAINQYTVTVNIGDGSEPFGTIGEQGASAGDVVPVVIAPVTHGTSAEFWTFAEPGYYAQVLPEPGCNFIYAGVDAPSGAVKFRAAEVSASCTLTVDFVQ